MEEKGLKLPFEAVIDIFHGFGDYAGIGDHWHKVVIAVPPGHDMGMDMVVDSGAGDPPQVHADIVKIGPWTSPEDPD